MSPPGHSHIGTNETGHTRQEAGLHLVGDRIAPADVALSDVDLMLLPDADRSNQVLHELGGHAVLSAVEGSGENIDLHAAVRSLAEREEADRDREVYALWRDPKSYEVIVNSSVEPEHYKALSAPEDWELSQRAIEPLRGKKVVEVGATYRGGGVAKIVPTLVNYFNKSGIETHWFTIEAEVTADGDRPEFRTTKDMHNIQQDQAGPEVVFDEDRQTRHQTLGKRNFEHLSQQENFKDADIYIIDDAQPAAMIEEIRKHYPNAMIVYRNHIQTHRDKMATPGTEQQKIQSYLRDVCGVGKADVYVAHPVEDFVPYGTPNVAFIPPTCDPFEDLNRDLSDTEQAEALASLNRQFHIQNMERRLKNRGDIDDQTPLDPNHPYMTLYARFDPAKGMGIGMELHARIIEKALAKNVSPDAIPQLLIIGNSSVDDPDRGPVMDEMFRLRREKYAKYKDLIKIIGVEHNYALANTVVRNSIFIENPSTAEGFEHLPSEANSKGIPAIVSNRGGLPLQVEDSRSGFVMNFDDEETTAKELERVAEAVTDTLADPDKYNALLSSTKAHGEAFNRREIGTLANVIRFGRALQGKGNRHWLIDDIADDMADEEFMMRRAEAYPEEVAA